MRPAHDGRTLDGRASTPYQLRAHGLRGGEVCGVEWPDLALDVAQPVVSVRQACVLVGREVVTGETETKESRRVLPLAPRP